MVFILAGPDAAPLDYDIQLAGTFVEVRGALELDGDTPVLRVRSIVPAP